MKLNALRKVGALSAVSAISLGYAVAGPMAPPPVVDSGTVPPPPPIDSGGGGIWDSVGATLSAGWDSDYIFRGVDLGDNFVWTQLDLAIPIGETVELGLGAWYTTPWNDNELDNELDLYASLGFDFGAWGLEVGYTHYHYPSSGAGTETNEIYISAGTTLWEIDLGLAYYYDFDLESHYIEATAATTFALTENVSLDPSIGVSYIDLDIDAPGFDDSGFNHFFARLDLPIQLTESATLTPYIATSVALDWLEDAGTNDYFYGGLSLSVDF